METDPKIALLIFFGIVILIFIVSKTGVLKKSFHDKLQSKKTDVEDILKQLYHVAYSGRKATLNAMGGALKMKDKKLVILIEYMMTLDLIYVSENVIHLTQSGNEYALRIIRTHRLWEKYLSEKTGIDKSEWHQRAEKMEHTLTSEEAEDLYQELGSPRFDPHGDPIPLKSGEIIDKVDMPLCGLEKDQEVKITHIEDEPEVIYKQIINKKLHVGQHLRVINVDDNSIDFNSEGQNYKLSTIVASNIGVRNLSKEEVFEDQNVRLSKLEEGEKAKVIGLSKECRGTNRRRLLDLGFIKGTQIETSLNGPMKEPKAYLIKNTLIALRNDQADLILIEKIT